MPLKNYTTKVPVNRTVAILGKNNPNWKGGISKDPKAYRKAYFQLHKEKSKIKSREWYRRNKIRGAEITLKSNRKVKYQILEFYGGNPAKCKCCGETAYAFLTIDHINNDGAKHRKEIKRGGGVAFYYWLKLNNFPSGFQVLCFNCNHAKALYEKCPHQD